MPLFVDPVRDGFNEVALTAYVQYTYTFHLPHFSGVSEWTRFICMI